jgi:hypothetical protein
MAGGAACERGSTGWHGARPAPRFRMMAPRRTPSDLARRSADALRRRPRGEPDDGFKRETFALEREAARAQARALFKRFPKAAYMTEIEHWRELPDGRIEFTMRRLPSAD